MDQHTLEQLRQRLTDEERDMVSQLKEMGMDPETGSPKDVSFEHGFADSGQSTAEKARLLSIAEGIHETLQEVRAALQRMAEGSYGRCQRCGTEIPSERLEARPHARLCMRCKQEAG